MEAAAGSDGAERDFFGAIAASLPESQNGSEAAACKVASQSQRRQTVKLAAAEKLAELRRVRWCRGRTDTGFSPFFSSQPPSTRAAAPAAARAAAAAHVFLSLPPTATTHRQAVVGGSTEFQTPYGKRPLVYTDWAASGRALAPIEDTVR